jgi:hypothetical protein
LTLLIVLSLGKLKHGTMLDGYWVGKLSRSEHRSDETLRYVFEQAGLDLIRTELAQLPVSEAATLFPVRMYALKCPR